MAKNLNTTAANTNAAAAPKRGRKTKGAAAEPVLMHSLESVEIVSDTPVMAGDDDLSALLAELGAGDEVVAADTPVEAAVADDADVVPAAAAEVTDTSVEDELNDALLEAAVGSAEAVEASVAAATDDTDADPGAAPTVEAEAAAKPKKTATPRKHYSDKVERLVDRVGDKLAEFTVLTINDAPVDDEAMKATMDTTLGIIRGMNSKEKNRAGNFIEFLSGKRAKLNNVLERVLGVLERDGFLTTGNEGNVMKDLLAKPYSAAAARAMGGNTIGMFADLKVILADGKGRYVANPDSLLLMKAQAMLGAAAAAPVSAAPVSETTKDDAAEEVAATTDATDAVKELEEALF